MFEIMCTIYKEIPFIVVNMVAAVNGPNNIPAIIATANETGISKAIIFFGEPYFVCVDLADSPECMG